MGLMDTVVSTIAEGNAMDHSEAENRPVATKNSESSEKV
jgi:hypothetical protein